MSGTRLTYIPQQYEVAYYNGLFATADTQHNGSIGGAEAVRFFATSNLPIEALKSVWKLADQPSTNFLDKPKFAVAVRLIQLLQNGVKGQGHTLAAPEGTVLRPAMFAGISETLVPLPQSGPQHSGTSARDMAPQSHHQQPMQQRPSQHYASGAQVQQQQPPPQYQQRSSLPPAVVEPPPLNHQQRMSLPPTPTSANTPPRPHQPTNHHPQNMAAPSSALVPQDPYTLSPNEQSRYESLFPEYSKDGFVYGPNAVALFSKSGVPQQQLGAIWTMVDVPVDHRLDKIEFVMAMHLIVCVGKKGLPLPNALPLSMKHLKSQQMDSNPQQQKQLQMQPSQQLQQQQFTPQIQTQHSTQQNQVQQQFTQKMQHQENPSSTFTSSMTPLRSESPMQTSIQAPSPHRSSVAELPDTPQTFSHGFSGLQGPPPLTQQAPDIHDAFEGLTPSTVSESLYMQNEKPLQTSTSFDLDKLENSNSSRQISGSSNFEKVGHSQGTHQRSSSEQDRELPKSTEQLKQAYNMGAASEELVKLKAILQKLQAENISLKASMQHLNEDEREVQKELNATVAEISKLSGELTTLRAKVLASKSRLLEVTSELKAAKEKKGVIMDLIAESTATKEAIDDAYEGIERAYETLHEKIDSSPANNAFEGDLFGFDAPAPTFAVPPETNLSVDQSSLPGTETAVTSFGSSEGYSPDLPYRNNEKGVSVPPSSMASIESDQNRKNQMLSVGSVFNEVTGGDEVGLSKDTHQRASYMFNPMKDRNEQESFGLQNLEAMKKNLKKAEDVARDAADSVLQVRSQVNELKIAAEESEAKQEAHSKQNEGKKKGLFGAGKKSAKETERLASDSNEKKVRLIEAQSQLEILEKVARETRREADDIRREIEEAELKFASAVSMEEQSSNQATTNGYSSARDNGPSYGFSSAYTEDSTGSQGGFGEPLGGQIGSGFNPSVMGKGGIEIPTPSAYGASSYDSFQLNL